ncbi:hypothetical protein RVR_664 [Actinacidiphila reveromycinica]|uniref:Lytic transglycosylase n=1 Tax=Actinacidiphila reveromycinica TaxID=659352 RepID=A0A7U3UNB2_9ACTN|nr:lytic transglycosylase [Streptomyces sp. SN-593]BBA95699.1 hypothetical protein RVR_664 [Streptomyces sp. SN-593]
MQFPTVSKKLPGVSSFNRLSKKHKITAAGTTAAAAVLLAVVGVEATAGAGSATAASDATTGFSVSAGQPVKPISVQSSLVSLTAAQHAKQQKVDLAAAAKTRVADAAHEAAAKKAAAHEAAAKKAAQEKAAAKKAAAKKAAASRAAKRSATKAKAKAKPAAKTYANNLDGWIRQSLDIMHKKGIPGSYAGIHRNIIRESSGNPKAINLWDVNARNGIPSKGLLQVINPTFDAFHVSGTSWNIYNPVANITAACNYAFHKYGSMDNVNSAY